MTGLAAPSSGISEHVLGTLIHTGSIWKQRKRKHPNIDPLKKQYYKAITHSELMVFQLSFLSFILLHDYVFIVLIHLINPDSHGFISLILSNTYDFFHLCAEFYITFIA